MFMHFLCINRIAFENSIDISDLFLYHVIGYKSNFNRKRRN